MTKMTNRVRLYIPNRHYSIVSSAVTQLSQVCGGCTCTERKGVWWSGATKQVEGVTTVEAWYVNAMLDDVSRVVTDIATQMKAKGEQGIMMEWLTPFGHYAEIIE